MTSEASPVAVKALVIEDSWEVRVSFVAALEDEGYEVEAAETGESGLEKFAEETPDIVITDLCMPGIDGLEVVRRIRETSDVPVIVVTAIGDHQTQDACMRAGATDFVIKGGDIDVLIQHAAECLAKRGQSSATPR